MRRYEGKRRLLPAGAAAALLAAPALLFVWAGYAQADDTVINYLLPHGHGGCLAWQPLLLWLHVGSDALIALSYYSMPVALFVFVRRRQDLQFSWMFVAFGIFILACGTTHLMSIWTLWDPAYLTAGSIKAITALVSVVTAVLLWFLLPQALALPGPAQWETVHQALRLRVAERVEAEQEVRRLNAELEQKVEERTRQLLEAQEELVRKEKLAILGQLSGSVGHELRNPLGVMSNAVYFLKAVQGNGDETIREYLGIIEHEIANSQRIITDLLDFARTKPPQRASITVRELVEQNLAKCAVPENVSVALDLPATLPEVKVDPLQMGEVLQNLVTNALQAMPAGGAVTIKGSEDHGVVRLSVSDTGAGIAPAHMHKLFQPLFTTKPRGIGLGLVVCRNLTEANGGKIEVHSELGQGTTFTVTLPAEIGGE